MKNFQKVEEFFKNSSGSKKTALYLLSLLALLFLFFKFTASLQEQEESLKEEIEYIKKSIRNENPATLAKKSRNLEREILKNKSRLSKLNEDINILESKLYEIPYLYKEKRFQKALEKILKSSIEKGITLKYIKNIPLDQNQTKALIEKKRLKIEGEGDFKSIIYFINDIEEVNILSDIKDVKLKKKKENISFSLIWILYGIKI